MQRSGLKTGDNHAIFSVLEIKDKKYHKENITKIEQKWLLFYFLTQRIIPQQMYDLALSLAHFWARSSTKLLNLLNYFKSLSKRIT